MSDHWNPKQYERFQRERSQPFHDLLAMLDVRRADRPRVLDLGCGTGALTRELHRATGALETTGVDSSKAMLASAAGIREAGLGFERATIEQFAMAHRGDRNFDIVFSNAALQWLDDHPSLFERLSELLADGGQLALQMPANHDHPSHLLANELAREEPFRKALKGFQRTSPVLAPEEYALLLDQLGYREPKVLLRVYLHHLPSARDVVEWVRGTLLISFESRMPAELYGLFLERYRERLLAMLGEARPHPYAFKRILMHATAGQD